MYRIVLQQVTEHIVIGEVVQGDDLDLRTFRRMYGSKNITADPAESINGNADWHPLASSWYFA
jgi:hypothetical protein